MANMRDDTTIYRGSDRIRCTRQPKWHEQFEYGVNLWLGREVFGEPRSRLTEKNVRGMR